MTVLLIDNYDSFVHTIARYVRELGEAPMIRRPDGLTADMVAALEPAAIILSPGPCSPREAPFSTELVRRFGGRTPILGICLGHQCIAAAYGAAIVRAQQPMHGRATAVHHSGGGLFAGLPSPFLAGRYHSLVVERGSLPPELTEAATSDDGEVMAIAHATNPVYGVQFHPESVLTAYGYHILARFLGRSCDAVLPAEADGVRATERRTRASRDPSAAATRASLP